LGEQKSDTQYKSKNLIFRKENITFMASERRTKIPFLLLSLSALFYTAEKKFFV